jgi:hypothetical protein
MAFCIRSDRKIDFEDNKNPNIGPGLYIKISKQVFKRNKIPFNSSTSKFKLTTNNTPGVGTYNLKKDGFDKIRKSQNNDNKNSSFSKDSKNLTNNSTIDKSYYNNLNQEKLGFLTKVERFKPLIKEDEINETFKEINNKKNKNLNKSRSYFNLRKTNDLKTGSLDRVLSIQSKDMNGYGVGYLEKPNLNVISINNNTPGPGYYNPLFQTKNQMLNWDKSINKEKEKKIDKFKNDIIQNMKNKSENIYLFNKIYNKLNSKKEHLILNEHYLVDKNRKKNFIELMEMNDYENETETPGPGYYEKELIENENVNDNENEIKKIENPLIKQFLKKKISKTIQNFGSRCNRFIEKKIIENNIGPTTYFIESNHKKKERESYYNIMKKNHSNDDNKRINKNLNINYPGPGSYNICKSFIKKSNSQKEFLNSAEIRFKNQINEKDIIPGPGSYINPFEEKYETQYEIINKEKRFYDNEQLENIQRNKIKKIQEQKRKSPSVGLYFPEIVNSIQFKLLTKFNPAQSIRTGFLQSSKRFEIKKQLHDNSPASYNPYNFETRKNKTINPSIFNTKEKRFFQFKNKSQVGPGQYNLNNSDDWNKKSFNVLFY